MIFNTLHKHHTKATPSIYNSASTMPSSSPLLPAAELGFVVVGVDVVAVGILVNIGDFEGGSDANVGSEFVGLPTRDAKPIEVHTATYPVAGHQLPAIF
jgi:hypothetical protein